MEETEKTKKPKGNGAMISLLLSWIPILVYGYLYNQLPEEIPSHYDLEGNVTDYLDKNQFWLVAFLPLLLWCLFLVLPNIDPKKENYAHFAKAYQYFHFGMIVFMDFIFFLSLTAVYATDTTYISKLVFVSVGLLFLGIGKIMPQIKPNFFMGIKTPWTLSNETVWVKTHKLAGVLFLVSGVLFCILPFLGEEMGNILMIPVIFLLLWPIPQSYFYYRKAEKGVD